MIEINELAFAYHQREVFGGINILAGPGELISILGPNGSGKTTLLRCLNKILKPTKGTIKIRGKRVSEIRLRELAKLIGYVPQSEKGTFPYTVFETVLMGRRPHIGWSIGNHDLTIVYDIIQHLQLDGLRQRNINELSGGERQRVLIARALAQEPVLMLLDEPTSSLDLRHQLDVLEVVAAAVKSKGMGAIMAMHDLNLAARFSDRIMMLHRGRMFCSGTPAEVMTPENIREVYGVEVDVRRQNGHLFIHPLRCAGALPGHHNPCSEGGH